MTRREVLNILKGTFHDPADKKYWQDKLREIEAQEKAARYNADFYRAYERGVKAFEEQKARKRRK